MKSIFYLTILLIPFLTACKQSNQNQQNHMQPSKVELKSENGIYRLYVNGEPFFVEGAGVDNGDIQALALHGGNAIRTWMDSDVHLPADEVLNQAAENGLMVMMGLPLERERHGFDYNDKDAVQEQFELIREKVLKMKDHPALLGWGIGNELNLRATNLKVWDAVEEIAAFIHEVDGNHPTTTMLAGIGKTEVDYIREHCPSLDFLSVQIYGDIGNLPNLIEEAGYDGPYLVTEWGATGHWEVPYTSWHAPIENQSSEKARDFKHPYESVILADKFHCHGSFFFLWGQKQERTPTWYGLFTEKGEATEAIDVMYYLWNDHWPENRAPMIHEITLDGKSGKDNIILPPGQAFDIHYKFEDPNGDSLKIRLEMLRESTDLKDGGDLEEKPESVDFKLHLLTETKARIVSPTEPGPYRLFIYGTDNQNHAATANIPFMVRM